MPQTFTGACSSVARLDDPRRRLRWLLASFVVACTGILGRLIALEVNSGDEYRAEAARPTVQRRAIPATRGRILAPDGTVLAADRPLVGIAVRYRYLEEPPDAHWLRATARARLTPRERRQPQRVADEEARVCEERDEMHRRLAELCGISLAEWQARCRRIQARVSQLADRVNSRRASRGAAADGDAATSDSSDDSWLSSTSRRLYRALFQANEDPPTTVVVTEELQEHVVFEGASLDTVAEIEGNPDKYPGITVIHASRRDYPGGSSAAHLLGYVRAAPIAADRSGQAGIERQYDAVLRGEEGAAADRFDRRGRLLSTTITQAPVAGRDLVVTIDPALQRAAETLLDDALARRVNIKDDRAERASGGSVVVIDVHSGAILAAATAPRFDPTAFAVGDAAAINGYLANPGHPLFDRAVQMAIPPGSVFKTVTAVALLHDPAFDPLRPFVCQGYLNSPEGRRCLIYRRYGIGHGSVTLVDALAQSCNVYFFHHAGEMGLAPLLLWGERTGFGERTGIDLPGEATGHLSDTLNAPAPASRSRQREDAESLAIGQGTLTATPLQIVRMMAAVANGGQLVTPHVVERLGLPASDSDDAVSQTDATTIDFAPPRPIPGLDPRKLEIVREGLRRVVTDPKGTGHATVALDDVEIAGKTGTAEAGDGQADHAWFAGYAPADAPRVAFVVVLEHAGDASATAGPVAKRLVERLQEMGYLRSAGRAH